MVCFTLVPNSQPTDGALQNAIAAFTCELHHSASLIVRLSDATRKLEAVRHLMTHHNSLEMPDGSGSYAVVYPSELYAALELKPKMFARELSEPMV
jgi:hypothetical protein